MGSGVSGAALPIPGQVTRANPSGAGPQFLHGARARGGRKPCCPKLQERRPLGILMSLDAARSASTPTAAGGVPAVRPGRSGPSPASNSAQKIAKYGKDTSRAAWLLRSLSPCRLGVVIAGDQTGVAVVVLSLCCLPTGVFFHSSLADHNHKLSFTENMILAGGLLQIVALGAGAICVDNRHSKDRGLSGRGGARRLVPKRPFERRQTSFGF
jgi:hypothetical protein